MGKRSRSKKERNVGGAVKEIPAKVVPIQQKPENLIGKSFQVQLMVASLESLARQQLPGELGRKLKPILLDVECNHRRGRTPVVTAHYTLEPDMANWGKPAVPPQPKIVKETKTNGSTKKGK